MQELINVHCHLLNFDFVPDSFFKTRVRIRESLLRRRSTAWLARVITLALNLCFWKERKYDKLHQALAIMRKNINDVAGTLVKEMRDANIVLATPLMMDLEIASLNVKPEIPYRYQAKLVSDIAIKYPGEIMPFIMFDPRRRSASDLIKTSLEEMGFLGVKMYPSLGYHPDPSSFYNDAEVNDELEEVYKFCEDNSIPITVHCSEGAAYSADLIRCKELVREFCQPSSWKAVLQRHPKLYLNLAHFGGNDQFMQTNNPRSWSTVIQRLMKDYDNVYADVSYHDIALRRGVSGDYFERLELLMDDDLIKDRIVLGTDWLMTRHTWTENQYVSAFMRLREDKLQQIAFQNPLNFLFPGRRLPQRIKQFFESNNVDESSLPPWMKRTLSIC